MLQGETKINVSWWAIMFQIFLYRPDWHGSNLGALKHTILDSLSPEDQTAPSRGLKRGERKSKERATRQQWVDWGMPKRCMSQLIIVGKMRCSINLIFHKFAKQSCRSQKCWYVRISQSDVVVVVMGEFTLTCEQCLMSLISNGYEDCCHLHSKIAQAHRINVLLEHQGDEGYVNYIGCVYWLYCFIWGGGDFDSLKRL